MKKAIMFLIIVSFLSCEMNTNHPKVIAYYTGNGETINEFDLSGVDQIIYSFLHLKDNELAIDNEADSISLLGIVEQKKNHPNLKVLVSLGGWGGCKTCSDVFNTEEGREDFAKSTAIPFVSPSKPHLFIL